MTLPHRPEPSSARIVGVVSILLLSLTGIFWRAYRLQVSEHQHLSRLAQEQYLGHVKIPARRGNIYDATGAPLAITVDVPSVFANPAAIADQAAMAALLSPLLSTPASHLQQRLQSGRYFVWLKRHVTSDVGERIKALKLPGVGLTDEPQRSYPNKEVAAHVLGFTGLDGDGLEGLEAYLDRHLIGAPQMVASLRDARGRGVLAGGLDVDKRARGGDVTLTLDAQVQHQAERALAHAVTTTGAKSASAIVLDVASAKVLAMAIAPLFSAHDAVSLSPERRRNRIVTDWVEPGSTLKPLVVAAALDTGAIAPHTKLFCEQGRYAIRGHTISDTHPHKWLTLTEVLAKSSNIGMAKISERLKRTELEASLRRFGMGQKTGIECPGEVGGLLRPAAAWSDLEAATIAFGQGMAVNMVQLAAAYRVLAADGEYKSPRLVETIRRGDGQVVRRPPQQQHTVVSVDAARRVTRMLEAAIMPSGGTGRLAAVEGFRVAGKTGTAQKADVATRGYSKDRYVALFAGYLPAEAPRAVIVVAVDEPKTNHYGGVVAAPVFAEIGAAAMQRMGVLASAGVPQVPPSKEEAAAMREAPAALQIPVDEDIGVSQSDATRSPKRGLPSFLGLSARQAIAQFVSLGSSAELRFSGTGRQVLRQEPAPGSRALPGVVHLVLGDAPAEKRE